MENNKQVEYVKKYDSKFERVNCRLPEGTKKRIEKIGYNSINKFIIAAVCEKLAQIEKNMK